MKITVTVEYRDIGSKDIAALPVVLNAGSIPVGVV